MNILHSVGPLNHQYRAVVVQTGPKIINCHLEVPRADRIMKIYINYPQYT